MCTDAAPTIEGLALLFGGGKTECLNLFYTTTPIVCVDFFLKVLSYMRFFSADAGFTCTFLLRLTASFKSNRTLVEVFSRLERLYAFICEQIFALFTTKLL